MPLAEGTLGIGIFVRQVGAVTLSLLVGKAPQFGWAYRMKRIRANTAVHSGPPAKLKHPHIGR